MQRPTVKNGTLEETEEFEEEVLRGRLELVVTVHAATLVDVSLRDTTGHLRLEPRGRRLGGDLLLLLAMLVDADLPLLPEGGERALLNNLGVIALVITAVALLLTDEVDELLVLFRGGLATLFHVGHVDLYLLLRGDVGCRVEGRRGAQGDMRPLKLRSCY